ncbi:hypothetical protein RQP46_000465 [Phenoliferia psychrophenolica]
MRGFSSLLLSSLALAPALAFPSPLQLDPTAEVAQRSTSQNSTFDESSGILSDSFPLNSFSLDDGEWIDVDVGVMVERDVVAESGKMLRRGSAKAGGVTRDLFSEEVSLPLDERGAIEWPTSWTGLGKLVKRGGASFSAVITWYTGHDLLNPYCAQKSGWTPTDSSMIAAVTEKWGKGRPACGSYLQVSTPHVDLSISAFKALYGLDIGLRLVVLRYEIEELTPLLFPPSLVSGMKIKTLSGPPVKTNKWTLKLKNLYGPISL